MELTEFLTSIGVCVVLPVLIVWLVLRYKKHNLDRRTEVLIKAMEAGIPIDENLLKSPTTPKKAKEKSQNQNTIYFHFFSIKTGKYTEKLSFALFLFSVFD